MEVEYAREIQEIKSRSESNTHQIAELKERTSKLEARSEMLYQMNENLALMAQSLKTIEGDVTEVKEDQKQLSDKVSTLENAPAQDTVAQLKNIKWSIISAICGALGMGVFWFLLENINKG